MIMRPSTIFDNNSRRGFFHWVQTSLLAAAGPLGAWGALAYLYPPGLRRRLRSPARVPGAESLPPGGSASVRIAGEPALLLKTESGYRAFSLVCTHLGCVVRWRPDEARKTTSQKKIAGHFACPCHGGAFDSEGKVVSGPPPRALERLEVRERNGQVFII